MARNQTRCPPAIPMRAGHLSEDQSLLLEMQDLAVKLRQRNFRAAVFLAFQAMRGEGPLVNHFAALGRDYLDEARAFERRTGEPERPVLQLIQGGVK